MSGIAIECATERVEVLVRDPQDQARAHEVEEVGHGHTARVAPLVHRALERAGVPAADLRWVVADLGPGSFTGVRVGLATGHALALAAGARLVGASSLAALAYSTPARRALVVPLVPAGRRQAFAGFFRADARGVKHLVAAPRVVDLGAAREAIEVARNLVRTSAVECVGPGAGRWREDLERAWPGSTSWSWRLDGLSATDLADAARSGLGPAAGLPGAGDGTRPLYVRSAQAEERVRRGVFAARPPALRPLELGDVAAVAAIERRVFSDPWPESFFRSELGGPSAYARVAERDGSLVGYSVAWLGDDVGHLGNLAVVPEARRGGVATALLADLLERARSGRVRRLVLEVRASNFGAQALYGAHGFRLAGLRPGYYRDTGEDALLMEWEEEPR